MSLATDCEVITMNDQVEFHIQNGTKSPLSPLEMKDTHLHGYKNGDSSITEAEPFEDRLPNNSSVKEMYLETEDEILNKIDTNDTLDHDTITDKLEDKLLEDSDQEMTTINRETEDNTEIVEDAKLSNGIHAAEEDSITQDHREVQDAEILKDQIMDTEDLLQIVDDTPITKGSEDDSDGDKPTEDHGMDEEFDSEPLMTDEEQIISHDIDIKDNHSECDEVQISEGEIDSDRVLSNENSCDKALVVSENFNTPDKGEDIDENSESSEIIHENTAVLVEESDVTGAVQKIDATDVIDETDAMEMIVDDSDHTDVVEKADAADVIHETDATEIIDDSAATEVVEKTDVADVVDDTDATDVVDETDVTDVVNETDATEMIDDTDAPDVVEKTDITDVVDETDAIDIVKQTNASYIVDESDDTDLVDETDAIDVVKQSDASYVVDESDDTDAVVKADVTDVVDKTDTADVIKQTDASCIVDESDDTDVVDESDGKNTFETSSVEKINDESEVDSMVEESNTIKEGSDTGEESNADDLVEKSETTVEGLDVDTTSSDKDTEKMDATDDSKKNKETLSNTSKRSLSESESEIEPKKPKLEEELDLTLCDNSEASTSDDISEFQESSIPEDAGPSQNPNISDDLKPMLNEEPDIANIDKICNANVFCDFLRNKNIQRLTRRDLEQFCLNVMCEAIFHRSQLGDLRHRLGVQEQMVEMWRKEVLQLSKQVRDLEIVNKRLIHEIRLKGDRDKPITPIKITRSVGLQVRSDKMMNIITPNRRPQRTQPVGNVQAIAPKPIIKQSNPPALASPVTSIASANAVTSKILTSKSNSLLTQALAASTASYSMANKSIVKTTIANTSLRVIPVKAPAGKPGLPKVTAVITQPQPTKPIDKTFIDLTDEEEKKPQSVSLAAASTTTTEVRVVKTSNNVVTTSSIANSPRIMYVYNNQLHQGVLAADLSKPGGQKLMLKLNPNVRGPTNGVLPTVQALRPGQSVRLTTPMTAVRNSLTAAKPVLRHPAPLPPPPLSQLSIAARKPIPPRPHLSIRRSSGGIVLSWKMPYTLDNYEAIASYQLYAYQETTGVPNSDMWRKVGDVKALALPMACTLTQFADGNKYHFAVRAVDVHKRMGQFSEPGQIIL